MWCHVTMVVNFRISKIYLDREGQLHCWSWMMGKKELPFFFFLGVIIHRKVMHDLNSPCWVKRELKGTKLTFPDSVNPVKIKLMSSPLLHLSVLPSMFNSTLLGSAQKKIKSLTVKKGSIGRFLGNWPPTPRLSQHEHLLLASLGQNWDWGKG